MTIQYKTKGVCSPADECKMENGVIQKVDILGGCAGNSQGVARLVEGMRAEDAIEKIAGIRCGNKATSCPDQLSKALQIAPGGGGQTSGGLTCPGVPIGYKMIFEGGKPSWQICISPAARSRGDFPAASESWLRTSKQAGGDPVGCCRVDHDKLRQIPPLWSATTAPISLPRAAIPGRSSLSGRSLTTIRSFPSPITTGRK